MKMRRLTRLQREELARDNNWTHCFYNNNGILCRIINANMDDCHAVTEDQYWAYMGKKPMDGNGDQK